MNKSEIARKYFLDGANCAQSVLCAFAPECGISVEDAMRFASGFGAGMGRLRETCGAVSGMILAANMLYGSPHPEDKTAKDRHYALIQKLAGAFRQENGSMICRELLGLKTAGADTPVSEARTAEYYKKRPCADLVALAAAILEQEISENRQ